MLAAPRKAEIHLLMPIYSKRAQFESVDVLGVANLKHLSRKWKLKSQPIVLKAESTFKYAFPHFVGTVTKKGKILPQMGFQHVGYYIMVPK